MLVDDVQFTQHFGREGIEDTHEYVDVHLFGNRRAGMLRSRKATVTSGIAVDELLFEVGVHSR